MEDNFKLVMKPHRRLNSNMKEVVKAKVTQLLDVGVIYPIFYSTWVSPMPVVPKKGGMIIVQNKKN